MARPYGGSGLNRNIASRVRRFSGGAVGWVLDDNQPSCIRYRRTSPMPCSSAFPTRLRNRAASASGSADSSSRPRRVAKVACAAHARHCRQSPARTDAAPRSGQGIRPAGAIPAADPPPIANEDPFMREGRVGVLADILQSFARNDMRNERVPTRKVTPNWSDMSSCDRTDQRAVSQGLQQAWTSRSEGMQVQMVLSECRRSN